MSSISIHDHQRIYQAIVQKYKKSADLQLIAGQFVAALIAGLIGWPLGSWQSGAAVGWILHAAFLILFNNDIEKQLKATAEAQAGHVRHRILTAPNIIKSKYFDCLESYSDNQMIKWAQRDFAIEITPEDVFKSYLK